jgi:hypothetical protein
MTPHHGPERSSLPSQLSNHSTPLSTSLSRIMRPNQSNGSRGLSFASRMQRPMVNNGMMDGHKVMGIENRGRPMLPMRDAGGWGNRLDANKVGTESPKRPISPAFRSLYPKKRHLIPVVQHTTTAQTRNRSATIHKSRNHPFPSRVCCTHPENAFPKHVLKPPNPKPPNLPTLKPKHAMESQSPSPS